MASKLTAGCPPQVGSFFMINLCLVVIATQFSETKQRDNQLMREQRARYLSNDSTLASFSEPGSCYEELLRYVGHVCRKLKRRGLRLYARWQSRWRKKVEPGGATHGQGSGRRPRRAGGRAASIHHLVYHHHHHHHHHYHFSHGSPRRPGPEPGAGDTRLVRARAPASPGRGPPDAESVHSVYHADCHVEGPQERARVAHAAATAAAGLKLATGLGAMNYPTILPSAAGSGKSGLGPKGKRPGGPPGAGGHSPLRLSSPDPCEKIQHLVGEHGKDLPLWGAVGGGAQGSWDIPTYEPSLLWSPGQGRERGPGGLRWEEVPPHLHPSCVVEQLMAQWGASVCHREMRILKLASKKEAPGPCPMASLAPSRAASCFSGGALGLHSWWGDCGWGRGERKPRSQSSQRLSRGARVPLGTPGPPTWAPGLTHLAHAGPWGHTRLRPPGGLHWQGHLGQGEVCVPGPPCVLTWCPGCHRTRACSSALRPGGAWPCGAPGCSESKPLWVQSHLGPRDSAGEAV